MANVRFTDAAIRLSQWSAITFNNVEGQPSAILTDDSGRLVVRGGKNGVRIINAKSEFVAEFTPDGDIITSKGKLSELYQRVEALEAALKRQK